MESVTASVDQIDQVVKAATNLVQQDTTSVIIKIAALLILAGAYIWYQNWKKNKEIKDARAQEEANRATELQTIENQNKIEANQLEADSQASNDFLK